MNALWIFNFDYVSTEDCQPQNKILWVLNTLSQEYFLKHLEKQIIYFHFSCMQHKKIFDSIVYHWHNSLCVESIIANNAKCFVFIEALRQVHDMCIVKKSLSFMPCLTNRRPHIFRLYSVSFTENARDDFVLFSGLFEDLLFHRLISLLSIFKIFPDHSQGLKIILLWPCLDHVCKSCWNIHEKMEMQILIFL